MNEFDCSINLQIAVLYTQNFGLHYTYEFLNNAKYKYTVCCFLNHLTILYS